MWIEVNVKIYETHLVEVATDNVEEAKQVAENLVEEMLMDEWDTISSVVEANPEHALTHIDRDKVHRNK